MTDPALSREDVEALLTAEWGPLRREWARVARSWLLQREALEAYHMTGACPWCLYGQGGPVKHADDCKYVRALEWADA